MKRTILKLPLVAALAAFLHAGPSSSTDFHLEGDVGVGATHSQTQVRGVQSKTDAVPYLNIEYGSAFARIDTFGVKALRLGYGHLEVLGQYRGDGYKSTELSKRHASVPLGLGTLQITPIGAFDVHVLHDLGKSGGSLVQVRYLAKLELGRVTVYPELGAEHQSRAYTGYYFGTTDADAAAIGLSYHPGSALNPFVGAMIETRIADRWYVNSYVRRTVVDDRVARSPLVMRRNRDSALLAIAYRF